MCEAMAVTQQSNGARLVSVEGRELPLRSVGLSGQAKGGLARVCLKQTFSNPHAEPLKVTYSTPLPADGAVAGYEFRIGARRVVGEIDRRSSARQRFEEALTEGRTAGILDQERANLFTQEIGNVPPRTEVAVELSIDQPLAWLPEGMWEWRFPTVVAPRYLGAEGRVQDAPKVTLEVAGGPTDARVSLDLAIGDAMAEGRRPESPSHALSIGGGAATRVTLTGENGVALDRDFVVRWAVPRPRPGVSLQTAHPSADRPHAGCAYGLLTIVPPEKPAGVYPRDLIVLLDTSGSMTGAPLDQARRVVSALVDSLTEADRLEMISFASSPQRWTKEPVAATPETRRQAHRWLAALRAGGGTEMLRGIEAALTPLRPDAQRQVALVTDGQIGFESEILRALERGLPPGSRLHAVGVGSAANRALTRPAARAGRGVEVLAGLDEDPERAAARLISATRGPAILDLEILGPALVGSAPRRLPDLMAGAPVLVGLSLRPEGGGLVVRGRTPEGPWEERLTAPPIESGAGNPGVAALYGRETVEDLELDLAAGADITEIDRAIEKIGLEFGLATRLTSWVAISEEPTVDPSQPVCRETMPQELPYGMSVEGLGLVSGMGQEFLMASTLGLVSNMTTARLASVYIPRGRKRRAGPLSLKADAILKEFSRTVPGRWVGTHPRGGQILEFEVTGAALDWRPAGEATVVFRDGRRFEHSPILQAMTAEGLIEPGHLVRLALQIEATTVPEIKSILVGCGETLLLITF